MTAALPPLLVVAGATATGKTGLAIDVAEALRADGVIAEVISADSRQVFRGLDIGTAKATVADRRAIPHHGLDLVDPDEAFSVADFVRHARAVLASIGERGGLAILAGGTGLYLRAVARGLDTDALRGGWARAGRCPAAGARADTRIADRHGEPAAGGPCPRDRRAARGRAAAATSRLRRARRVDRASAGAGDARRLDRGACQGAVRRGAHRRGSRPPRALRPEPARVLRHLRERYDPSLPAFSAIGYREAWAVLDGTLTREAAIELDARRNQQFARRQATWFRTEPGIEWLDAADAPLPRTLEVARTLVTGI